MRLATLSIALIAALAIGKVGAAGDSDPARWERVSSILSRHCAACHDAGGAAPIRLVTARDLSRRREQVVEVLENGRMPPWIGAGGGSVALAGPAPLSASERQECIEWLKAGLPGVESGARVAPPVSGADAARGGAGASAPANDLCISMPSPWLVPADGPDQMRSLVLPVENAAPLLLRGLRWESAAADAIDSVSLVADVTGTARRSAGADGAPGFAGPGDIGLDTSGSAGAFGRGVDRFELPRGFAIPIPARADLVAEVHASSVGRSRALLGRLELEFADPGATPAAGLPLFTTNVDIAPGAKDVTLEAKITLPRAVQWLGALPRAHTVCVSMRLIAREPGKAERILLDIPRWNPHFRRPLVAAEPLHLAAGTELIARWDFDNSESNPANPSRPPQRVQLGMDARNEWPGFVSWIAPEPGGDAAAVAQMARDLTIEQINR